MLPNSATRAFELPALAKRQSAVFPRRAPTDLRAEVHGGVSKPGSTVGRRGRGDSVVCRRPLLRRWHRWGATDAVVEAAMPGERSCARLPIPVHARDHESSCQRSGLRRRDGLTEQDSARHRPTFTSSSGRGVRSLISRLFAGADVESVDARPSETGSAWHYAGHLHCPASLPCRRVAC